MAFSEDLKERIKKIMSKYETKQSALIPVLHEVQREYGWLSLDSMKEVAELLSIPPADVQNVATFYTMFFTKPVGKHIIWLCRTLPCALRGAQQVEHYISEKLGIKPGETTPDGKITFFEAECLASCGTAPVMLVDDELYENLTRKKIDELIEKLRAD
ncbi:MAG: NADH-quinone oxidoreductase subunit E [Deltaproteobacteria bacterium]|jgi:NADH-quinone oxidoreductase subunit E|nr:NADH-quinone oxidoreductase subunit 2 [bacterium HR37]GIW46659.1 MAG: NADH-quinone oxidoreductase subunit E [Deltaproteobacteria bacterium]